jgi:hypothetical protein
MLAKKNSRILSQLLLRKNNILHYHANVKQATYYYSMYWLVQLSQIFTNFHLYFNVQIQRLNMKFLREVQYGILYLCKLYLRQ